nr:Putative transposon-related protein [Bacillaceae bacterium JMAK1]
MSQWVQRVKEYFGKIKRDKKESRTLPKAKKSSKPLIVLIWSLLIILVLTSPLALIRAQNALNTSQTAQASIEDVQGSLDEETEDEAYLYQSEDIRVFAEAVIDRFINISSSSNNRETALESLNNYYADGVPLPDWNGIEGYRELNSATYYNMELRGDHAVLQYRVDYVNYYLEDEDEEEYEDQFRRALLNVPVKAIEDEGYIVISNPFFEELPMLTAEDGGEKPINPLEDAENQLSVMEQEPIETFLADFFEIYASSEATDLNYIMDEPQAMDGLYNYERLENTVVVEIAENHYQVVTTVAFSDPELGIEQFEDYSMELLLEDNRFFVSEFENSYLGVN